MLIALLPILDDFDCAIENIQKSDDVNALKEGVELIAGKLNKTLASQGLQKMDTIGKPFDTDYHEAIALVPAQDEDKKNLVMDCVQPGYMLNDKVLRHAKVVVGNSIIVAEANKSKQQVYPPKLSKWLTRKIIIKY